MSHISNTPSMGHLLNTMTANRDRISHVKLSNIKGAQWKVFEDRIPATALLIKKTSRNFANNDEKWRIQRLNSDGSAIVRLDNRDRDVYGTCPEHDSFLGVICNVCSEIIKPSSLAKHIRNRHCQYNLSSSNRSNCLPSVATFNTREVRDGVGFVSTLYVTTGSGTHYTSTLTNSTSKLKISMSALTTSKNVNQSLKPKNRSLVYTKPKPKNSGKRGPTVLESESIDSSLVKVFFDDTENVFQSQPDPLIIPKGIKTTNLLSNQVMFNLNERKSLQPLRRKALSGLKGMRWSAFEQMTESWKASNESIAIKYSKLAMKRNSKLDIMRLDYCDRGVFGLSPETEELCAVICNACSAVVKPQGLLIHQQHHGCLNHSSNASRSNSTWSASNNYSNSNRYLPKFSTPTKSKGKQMPMTTNTVTISMAPPTSCSASSQTQRKSKNRSSSHSKIKSKHRKGSSHTSSQSTSLPDKVFNICPTWSSEATTSRTNFSNEYSHPQFKSISVTGIVPANSVVITSSSSSSSSNSSSCSSSSSSSTSSSQRNRNSTSQRCLPIKDRAYDSDKHCGVISADTNKPCTRSLTCRSHMISLRRAVPGRSKSFDKLLTDHKKAKGNFVITSSKSNPLPKVIRVKTYDNESSSNSSSSFDLERRSSHTSILNSNSNSCSSLLLQAADVPSTLPTSLLMSPILTNMMASNNRNTNSTYSIREGSQQNPPQTSLSSIAKSLNADSPKDNLPIHIDLTGGKRRLPSGKRPPSNGPLNQSENGKRMRMTNSGSRRTENHALTVVPLNSENKVSVMDDVLMESQYIVENGEQVVYINEGQINRSSDMGGIENETVEALIQSLSPYEFSFNEMGQLMITEPIFQNEDTTLNAAVIQDPNIIIADDVVSDQQLSECNITTDDLDDIDQLVAPILENSEAEGFDLVAYTMKKSTDSSSNIKDNRSAYSLLTKNKQSDKLHSQNHNSLSMYQLAELDHLQYYGEPIEMGNNVIDDIIPTDYQMLFSDSDGTDDETAEDELFTNNDESLFFGSNDYFTLDMENKNGVVPSDSGNGYGEKENNDVDDFRGIRNWYGSVPKPSTVNRFGLGKTRGGSALRRNILTARKSNPTHQAYNYAINNHSIKFSNNNHESSIRLDQNGSTTNTFQLIRTNGSAIRANQVISNNSVSGNAAGVASVLNRTGGRRIGQIVQTPKLNRRLMTLGTAFDNAPVGAQFLRPVNPKANQLDDKLKILKRGVQKVNQSIPGFRLSNILPNGATVNGFSLDDILGARPRNERNISGHSGGHSSNHETSMNGTTKKAKSSSFNKDNNQNSNNMKTSHASLQSSSVAGKSILKNNVYSTSYNAKHSSNRSNNRYTSSSSTNLSTSVTTALTSTSSLTSNGSPNTFTIASTQPANVILVNGTTASVANNRGRSLIRTSLYSRSVSGGKGKGFSGSSINPRK